MLSAIRVWRGTRPFPHSAADLRSVQTVGGPHQHVSSLTRMWVVDQNFEGFKCTRTTLTF